jgi:hypothetical protein
LHVAEYPFRKTTLSRDAAPLNRFAQKNEKRSRKIYFGGTAGAGGPGSEAPLGLLAAPAFER